MTESPSNVFVCRTCGKSHEGLPRDQGWQLPDDVWAIPEDERSAKAKFNSDLCQFGDRFFLRGLLPVPMLGTNDYFGWGIWVEVEQGVFDEYLSLYDKDGSSSPRHEGNLANVPPPYPDAHKAAVLIQFGPASERPKIYFPENCLLLFAKEQREGIDHARFHQILDALKK